MNSRYSKGKKTDRKKETGKKRNKKKETGSSVLIFFLQLGPVQSWVSLTLG
jgi:hypothetical protein